MTGRWWLWDGERWAEPSGHTNIEVTVDAGKFIRAVEEGRPLGAWALRALRALWREAAA